MSDRRWFQLSLKSLFLLTLLVATFLAGYSLRGKQHEAQRRQAELEAQRKAEEARYQIDWASGTGYPVRDFDGNGRIDLTITRPQQPARSLGEGKFRDVTGSAGVSR